MCRAAFVFDATPGDFGMETGEGLRDGVCLRLSRFLATRGQGKRVGLGLTPAANRAAAPVAARPIVAAGTLSGPMGLDANRLDHIQSAVEDIENLGHDAALRV